MRHLTLVVASRGRPAGLPKLLASLAHQTLPRARWDLILVDDGTPPPVAAQARREVEALGEGARYEWIEHGGPAKARNHGTRLAKGDVVLFLNNDVELAPRHVKRHWDAHEAHPERNFAAHGETVWPGEVVRGAHMRVLRERVIDYESPVSDWERPFVLFCTSSLSVKRDLLLQYPFDEGFPEPCFEDTELGWRLTMKEGLRVELLRGDPARHWHYHTRRAFLRRAAMNGRNAPLMLERIPDFRYRLIGIHENTTPRWRAARALGRALRGDMEGFWGELERAVYMRAFWREARRRKRQAEEGFNTEAQRAQR